MGISQSSFKKRRRRKESKSSEAKDNDVWVTVKATTTDKRSRAIVNKKIKFRASSAGTWIGSAGDCDLCLDDANVSAHHLRVFADEKGNVTLLSTGRTYLLIGQGAKSSGKHSVEKGQIIKMGACSLLVNETCIEPDPNSVPKPAALTEGADSMCYICFSDHSAEEDPLIHSPCTCKNLVHRLCLAKWIATKGSRLCSICKAKLPIECTVQAPYMVLQVVRHMRGLHWTGEREYIVSFAQKPGRSVSVGSGPECDLSLPDPSLSRCHARLMFDENRFGIEDLMSSAGTFVRVAGQLAMVPEQKREFKVGRTLLTVKVSRGGGGDGGSAGVASGRGSASAVSPSQAPFNSEWTDQGPIMMPPAPGASGGGGGSGEVDPGLDEIPLSTP